MNQVMIQTFLTLAASQSLSQAAEALFITQPALSHRLATLEDELNVSLIERGKGVRTIQLTQEGQQFLPIAKKWDELWHESQFLNKDTQRRPLRIANVDSLNDYFMPRVYTHFIREHRQVKLTISTLRSNAAYKALEQYELDFAFITNPHFFNKVRTIPLFNESMFFVCSKEAPYGPEVSPSELDSQNEIYIPWGNSFMLWHDYWFSNHEDVLVAIDNMSLFKHFLKLEKAWAILPSTVAYALVNTGDFKMCHMTDGPDDRTCYGISNTKTKEETLDEKDFIKSLLEIAATYPDVHIIYKESE